MPEKSSEYKPVGYFPFTRVVQISESHCGPAVVQMLLANLGIAVTQEQIAEAGGATALIELNGMRVDQLASAVAGLAPQAQFWYKDRCELEELIALVKEHNVPVGVEWQGLFETDEDEADEGEDDSETEDDDFGHYSVVTHIDEENRQLIIVDPYKDFVSQDRIFTFEQFVDRWWDFNEVPDPNTGQGRLVEDYHMLFIITPAAATFPLVLGMKTVYQG